MLDVEITEILGNVKDAIEWYELGRETPTQECYNRAQKIVRTLSVDECNYFRECYPNTQELLYYAPVSMWRMWTDLITEVKKELKRDVR